MKRMTMRLMMMMKITKASWLRLVRQRNQVGGWNASPHLSIFCAFIFLLFSPHFFAFIFLMETPLRNIRY